MPEEFGTVNVRREDRAKELEAIRQRFRRHRETLTNLAADAPTLALGMEYNRLIKELDASVLKLDALEERTPNDTQPMQPLKKTDPGRRPLTPAPPMFEFHAPEKAPRTTTRIVLIVLTGLVVLGAISWLMWQASSDELPVTSTIAQSIGTNITPATIEPVTPAPAPAPALGPALTVEPASQDFGAIRRGSRPSRQYEITNHTDQLIPIQVSRSKCRCLFYAHNGTIAPNQKETVTVTMDATRVKARRLRETIKVSDKNNPANETSFNVTATIR